MNTTRISTPGVYINEVNAFPNSVLPVPTAIPAFVGYTPQAVYEGKSYKNVVQKISSFLDFKAIYCLPDPAEPAAPAKQYNPQYYLVKQSAAPAGNYMILDGGYYSVEYDPNTIYYLYNSIRLFYENGGGDAYIVSVGSYGPASGKSVPVGSPTINPNVVLNDLLGGLGLLKNDPEPTMYLCPDATLLSIPDNGTLMQAMLQQCNEVQSAVSIFDIIGSKAPDPVTYMNDINVFRQNTGNVALNYGAAYYPFVTTAIMQQEEIDYTNLFGGDTTRLAPIISPADNPNPDITTILAQIQKQPTSLTVTQYNNALLNASELYREILQRVLTDANTLPPGGAIAGVITTTDSQIGVWEAPANRGIVSSVALPINVTDSEQAKLNADAVSGKSVNAIRSFNGTGILVWGARTLDGNSQDWKYLTVRRTIMMIEQSCKLAARAFVFEPNDSNTWMSLKSMISGFLTQVWKDGGLQGASASDAFSVDCGLGTTMTAEDILNSFLNVSIQVAVVHPAEFIVITFQQQQQAASS